MAAGAAPAAGVAEAAAAGAPADGAPTLLIKSVTLTLSSAFENNPKNFSYLKILNLYF